MKATNKNQHQRCLDGLQWLLTLTSDTAKQRHVPKHYRKIVEYLDSELGMKWNWLQDKDAIYPNSFIQCFSRLEIVSIKLINAKRRLHSKFQESISPISIDFSN